MSLSGFIAFYLGVYYIYRIIFIMPGLYIFDKKEKKSDKTVTKNNTTDNKKN